MLQRKIPGKIPVFDGKIPVFDGLGDIVSNLYIIEEHVSWNQERLLVLLEGLVQVFFKEFSFSRWALDKAVNFQ